MLETERVVKRIGCRAYVRRGVSQVQALHFFLCCDACSECFQPLLTHRSTVYATLAVDVWEVRNVCITPFAADCGPRKELGVHNGPFPIGCVCSAREFRDRRVTMRTPGREDEEDGLWILRQERTDVFFVLLLHNICGFLVILARLVCARSEVDAACVLLQRFISSVVQVPIDRSGRRARKSSTYRLPYISYGPKYGINLPRGSAVQVCWSRLWGSQYAHEQKKCDNTEQESAGGSRAG